MPQIVSIGFVRMLIAACLISTGNAVAAEIHVMSAGAVEPGLLQLIERFGRETGHRVEVRFNTAPQLTKRLADGAAADLLIAPPRLLDEQAKLAKVRAESIAVVGRVGVGVVVRTSAANPDVGSTDALKSALVSADSVVYNEASTGLYLEQLFGRLGIAAALKPKTTRYANGPQVLDHIIKGSGNEIGFGAIPEIKMYEAKGLRLAGPLPADIQNYTTYSAGVMTAAREPEAASSFLRYLTSPAARGVFAATGVE